MIPPKKNLLISGFFRRYITYIIRKNFHAVNYNPLTPAVNQSILLLPNHYSWWDGFLMYHLNNLLFKKKFHVMILEQTSKKFFFLKYLGGYTVNKGTKDVITSLEYTAELLKDPQNLVLIFPQGSLYSNFTDEVKFQNGLSKVIKQAAGHFQTIFAVSFIEHMQFKKPTVNINLQLNAHQFEGIDALRTAYQQYYTESKLSQSKIVV